MAQEPEDVHALTGAAQVEGFDLDLALDLCQLAENAYKPLEEAKKCVLCLCKHTDDAPYCDGTHKTACN